MVKNLSVAVLDLCFLKHTKELPWEGFLPDQGLSGISIDLDTLRLHEYHNFFLAVRFYFMPFQFEMAEYAF